MATEIGALLISMQADVARLRKDMADGKGIVERAAGDMSRAVDTVRNAISLLGVGVTAGGLVHFAKQAVDAADNMGKLSQRIGIGTKELAQWKFVADLSGTSVESLGKGVKGLATYIQSNGDRLKVMGIDTLDANKAMLQLADIVAALPDDMQQAALMSELFGAKVGAELIPAFNLGSKGIAELKAKADDYATRLAQLAPDAEAFNDALTEMGLQSQIAAINIGNALIPGLSGMVQWLNDAAAGGDRAKTALQFLADMDSPLMRGLVSMHRALRPDEFTSNGWKLAGMDPVTGRSTAPAAGGYNPWGSDAAFMARTQASILLGGGKGGKATAAKFEQSPAFLGWQQSQRAGESGLSAKEIMTQLHAEDAAAERSAAAVEKLRLKYIDIADPLQKYRDQLDEVNRLRADGTLTAAQALAAEWEIGDAMDEAAKKMTGLKEAGIDAFAGLKEAVDGWGKSAAGTFADWATGAEVSIGRVAQSMAREFIQQQAYQRLFQPIFSKGADWLTSAFPNADGGVYATPGLHAYANTVVDRPTIFPFARGVGLMGEAGPEAIMPLSRGADGKLGVKAQGGGVVVQVIEAPGQGGQVRQRQEGGQNIVEVLVERVKSSVAADIVRGTGAVPGAMASAYGLNRVAGAY